MLNGISRWQTRKQVFNEKGEKIHNTSSNLILIYSTLLAENPI